MVKKMIVGVVLIVIGFFLILFQLNAINQIRDKEEFVKIYTLANNIEFGKAIKYNELNEIYIRKVDVKEEYVTNMDNEVYYLLDDKKKESLLLKSDLSKEKPIEKYLKDNSKDIITLDLSIEEANGWNFNEFEEVDLYFISSTPDKENEVYENLIVYKIINQEPFKDEYSSVQTPQYLSLIVPKEQTLEIISNKNYGKFEIVIN